MFVQTTVHEALMFSSRLRFTNEVDDETVKEFVEEVSPLILKQSNLAS